MAEKTIKGEGVNLVTGCPDRQECMGCDVPLMHVPRCETCRHWQPGIVVRGKLRGNCWNIGISCNLDFGCVQWKGKE